MTQNIFRIHMPSHGSKKILSLMKWSLMLITQFNKICDDDNYSVVHIFSCLFRKHLPSINKTTKTYKAAMSSVNSSDIERGLKPSLFCGKNLPMTLKTMCVKFVRFYFDDTKNHV